MCHFFFRFTTLATYTQKPLKNDARVRITGASFRP